jgi:hypothetical protein
MRESLSSNREDIHRAIAALPGRYNANPKVVMGFPLKRDAHYMIERHSERQISVQFYDTTGDSIAAFVAAIKDGGREFDDVSQFILGGKPATLDNLPPKPEGPVERCMSSPNYDHARAEAYLAHYCAELAPDAVIDDEFGTRLNDAELIRAVQSECRISPRALGSA